MTTPSTEDIAVLRDLIEDTELDPTKDSIHDLLVILKDARYKLEQGERTLMWALSNCGITASHFLEPALEVIATESAREHARLGRKIGEAQELDLGRPTVQSLYKPLEE